MKLTVQNSSAPATAKARMSALKAISKLTRIDLSAAVKSKRHNPILDSEIPIEEELINLREALATYHAAGDTLQEYPDMYKHVTRERRAIMKHCLGLLVRMLHGKRVPRPYSIPDIDDALRRLVQLVVYEIRREGKRIDEELLRVFRPFLTVRQRVALRDFGMDLVIQASRLREASALAGRLQGFGRRA